MKKTFQTLNHNSFDMEVCEPDDVSVLAEGYIITVDGSFLPIGKDDHAVAFSQYLKKYLEKESYYRDSTDAAYELCALGNVVYFGIRLGDRAVDANFNSGYGVLILPEALSDFQEDSIACLLRTNKSIFGKRKKLELKIAYFSKFADGTPLNEDDFLRDLEEKISSKNNKLLL